MASEGCQHIIDFKSAHGTSAFQLIYGVFVFCSNKATRGQKVSCFLSADRLCCYARAGCTTLYILNIVIDRLLLHSNFFCYLLI